MYPQRGQRQKTSVSTFPAGDNAKNLPQPLSEILDGSLYCPPRHSDASCAIIAVSHWMDLIRFPAGRNFVGVEIKTDVMNDNKENVKTIVLEVIKHQGDSSFQHWMECTGLEFAELSSVIGTLLKDGKLTLHTVEEQRTKHPYMPHDKQIFIRFMELLSKYFTQERHVEFYASKMCISPKYLSTTVKQVSGKTPTVWITNRTIEEIKHRLLHTQDTIKEIAYTLNFPNLSFFGKFFKKATGMSPKQYRTHNIIYFSLSPIGVFTENCNFMLE